MKRRLRTLAAIVLSVSASAHAGSIKDTMDAVNSCPKKDGPSLEAWRDKMSSGYIDYESKNALYNCFPEGTPSCLKRMQSYYSSITDPQRVFEPEELKYVMPPKEMLAQGAAGTPTDLKFALFQKAPDGTVMTIEEIAKKNKWLTVRYKSRHSGGFDGETPSLLMIKVPGDGYDQYINIALPTDPSDEEADPLKVKPIPEAKIPTSDQEYWSFPSHFTIVTVAKGKNGKPPKVYFNKFYHGRGSSSFEAESREGLGSLRGCYECHPNGLRAISPLGYGVTEQQRLAGQVLPPEQWAAVKAMNDAMEKSNGHGMVSWGEGKGSDGNLHPMVDHDGLGPIYGPTLEMSLTAKDGKMHTREADYILGTKEKPGCALNQSEYNLTDVFGRAPGRGNIYKLSNQPKIRPEMVAKAMNCAKCHDGKIRGTLNIHTGFDTIAFKILVDRSMPKGWHQNPGDQEEDGAHVKDQLTDDERIALVSCIRSEFREESAQIKKWLTAVSCAANENKVEPDAKVSDWMRHKALEEQHIPAEPRLQDFNSRGVFEGPHP